MFQGFIFPGTNWLFLVFWIAPIITIFTILVEVLVSARAKSFQEAQQIGGLVILPIIALFVGQATGFLILNPLILLIIGIVLLVLSGLLLKLITKFNSRNVLFERQI
ncbi:hypothetical protein ACFSCX_11895 [Bacillus salitolerans]|uniref:Uncharacterized protein n=1 Tax=Bacillus salitolerans TaxID=1437434 RepID=A0ABW4LPZ5_9BACI